MACLKMMQNFSLKSHFIAIGKLFPELVKFYVYVFHIDYSIAGTWYEVILGQF